MDSLVARYSRSAALQSETLTENQHDDLENDINPTLSLKFAMPPVAQVRITPSPETPMPFDNCLFALCILG
jgi:hypothetical protein